MRSTLPANTDLNRHVQALPEQPIRCLHRGIALPMVESLGACDARNRGEMLRLRGATATDPDEGYICEWDGAALAWQGFTLATNDARYVNVSGDTMTDGLEVVFGTTARNLILSRYTANTTPARLDFEKSRNATPGAHTVVTSGDGLMDMRFRGSDGVQYRDAASIQAFVDGAVAGGGAADMPGRIVFNTTPDGSASLAERLRIGSAELVVNEPGNAYDVRIEGDTVPDLFFLDASDDTVYIEVLRTPDSGFALFDNVDTTKLAQFQASGIATATTRTYTLPNANGTLGLFTQSEGLTIATGVVTTTLLTPIIFLTIDTEAAAASDTLDTINGGITGQVAIVKSALSARDVIIGDATGNLRTAGAFTLDTSNDTITFIWTGTVWLEIGRANND